MAVTVVTPVHVAPVVHMAPAVRVNPGAHVHSSIKAGTKARGTHSRYIPIVTDTPTTKKCADQKSGKECQKK